MEQPRRGIADSAIIDWLTFTFPTKNLNKLSDTPITNDGEAILFISSLLENLLGLELPRKLSSAVNLGFSENAIPVGLMMFYILMFLLAMILRLFALRLRALVVMLLKRDGNKAFTAS